MQVFVLTTAYDYEGEALVGVFSSLENAQAASKTAGYCDEVVVYRVVVDARAAPEQVWSADGRHGLKFPVHSEKVDR